MNWLCTYKRTWNEGTHNGCKPGPVAKRYAEGTVQAVQKVVEHKIIQFLASLDHAKDYQKE